MSYSLFAFRQDCDNFGVTAAEVADYIGISRSNLYRRIYRGDDIQINEIMETIKTVSGLKYES